MARKRIAKNVAFDDEKQRYYVTFHYGMNAGRRVRRTQTYHRQEDALQAAHSFEALRLQRRLIAPRLLTLNQWLDTWLNNIVTPTRAASTVYGYTNIIDHHLRPALGEVPLQRLTPAQIQHYYAEKLRSGYNPNTVRKHHQLLYTALELAVRQGYLEQNPVRLVDSPAPVPPKHTYYNSMQLRALFDLVTGTQLELVVKLAGFLGMRRSEICALKWCNVDFRCHIIDVCEARTAVGGTVVEKGTKTDASCRMLDFSDLQELRQLLLAEQARQRVRRCYRETGYVVVRPDGKPYQPDYLSGCFHTFVQAHGLPPITLHGLRHSFASVANSCHVPLFDIGKAMGHSSTGVTSRIYTHLFDTAHRSAIRAVGTAIENPEL